MKKNEAKGKIRREILGKRLRLAEEEIREKSLLIKDKLFGLNQFQKAKLIMFYASFKNEVRTWEMIEEAISCGKKVGLPVLSKKGDITPYLVRKLSRDVSEGRFGVPEPEPDESCKVNADEIDIVIVPGVAFDRLGRRIGFGKGCYDRFLRSVKPEVFCIGLAFEMQMVENIPVEEYDEKVDMVITETNIYL